MALVAYSYDGESTLTFSTVDQMDFT